MTITIETTLDAPVEPAWRAWTTPADIERWNAADDSDVELRRRGRQAILDRF